MKRGPGGRRRNSACSSRLSSISTDNAYLKEWSSPITLTLKPLSSDKDIIQFLAFLLHDRLRYPINDDDNLFTELKCITLTLKSPLHLTNSELKNPGTPHSFPRVLAVLHWLVQLAMHNDHLLLLSSDDHAHDILSCHKKSYGHYLNGQDDAIERTYEPFNEILKQEKNLLLENVNVLLAEANLEVMKSAPSLKESRENVKKESEKDIDKFNALIDRLQQMDAKMQMELEDKEKELRLKADERNKICEENEELKKKVEEQAINMRDAERMKRELQSVERDIADAEIERSKWEDKCWDLDAVIGTKFKELEALQTECNQAIRTLKLGNDIQYELNANGTAAAEVLGMDYKSRLDPVLSTARDEVKRSSMEKLETLMSLQQLLQDIAAKIDAKRNRIVLLQSRIVEVENQLNSILNETQDYASRCAMKARQLVGNFEVESRKVDLAEKEAREFVESSKAKLHETSRQCQKEVEMCEQELLALIDMVSKYKEFTGSKISEMNNAVSEAVAAIAQVHKDAIKSSLRI